jgi:hypothetical protein
MALLGTWRRHRRVVPAAIPDSECLVSPFVVVAAVGEDHESEENDEDQGWRRHRVSVAALRRVRG